MKRQPLTEANGSWFDLDTAEEFSESTYWDGSNHISRNTGSQWSGQALYRTKSKRWVLQSWSAYDQGNQTWEEISDEEAAGWLVTNHQDHPDAAELIEALEI